MAKKRRNNRRDRDRARVARPEAHFTSPFRDLKKLIAGHKNLSVQAPVHQPAVVATEEPVPDEGALLRQAYEGVRPLNNGDGGRAASAPPRVNRAIVSEEAEVMAQLSDLVSGQGRFDLTETDEYVEGARMGLDPRLVTRLRRGEFAWQAHLDLHGMVQTAAHEALTAFIIDAVRKGHRAVLIVTGRGLRSPGGRPVLKHAAAEWLSHGAVGGHVLAFTSARPADGGAGALYVMLRRSRRRAPFEVLEGARRRD